MNPSGRAGLRVVSGMRITPRHVLSGDDLAWLRKQAASAVTTRRLVERCQIVLRATEGTTNEQIAAALGITRHRVSIPTSHRPAPRGSTWRSVFSRSHRHARAEWGLPQPAAADRRTGEVGSPTQQGSEALHLDGPSQGHPGLGHSRPSKAQPAQTQHSLSRTRQVRLSPPLQPPPVPSRPEEGGGMGGVRPARRAYGLQPRVGRME